MPPDTGTWQKATSPSSQLFVRRTRGAMAAEIQPGGFVTMQIKLRDETRAASNVTIPSNITQPKRTKPNELAFDWLMKQSASCLSLGSS
jgi:hypothetical protein